MTKNDGWAIASGEEQPWRGASGGGGGGGRGGWIHGGVLRILLSAEDPGRGGGGGGGGADAQAQGLVVVCEASLHGRINMGRMVEPRGGRGADAGVPGEPQ